MHEHSANDPKAGLTRRGFCKAGIGMAGAVSLVSQTAATADDDATSKAEPFSHYSELLKTVTDRGHEYRVLGVAPDRSPLIAVKAGGDKKPAILISAGSHSTEHAGVRAAVELIDRLETEHEVWVLPCRDPIGLNGLRYVLEMALGKAPDVETPQEAEALIREKGEVLLDTGENFLALIGEIGFANRMLYRQIEKGAPFLEALKGRRVYYPSVTDDMPGAGPLERAYTLIITPDGEILHLNRFHGTAWAPVEVRCIRALMAEIQPGLTFDLHEHSRGDFYWMSARRQRSDAEEALERQMASEGIAAVAATGAKLAPEDYSPGSFFQRLERGVYWLDPGERGEGLNLIDFAARHYGPGFTIESGMKAPFADRMRQQLAVVQAAVSLFEQHHGAA